MSDGLLRVVLAKLDRGDAPKHKWPDAKGEYWALCPFHPDRHATNFSVSAKGYHCFACGASGTLAQLADRLDVGRVKRAPPNLTVSSYAQAKRLPVRFLKKLGLAERRTPSGVYVEIPYRDEDGKVVAIRRRYAMEGRKQFAWKRRSKMTLYGLWRLPQIREVGWVLLVEGESDCHTAWLYGLPALGVPGASMWRKQWARYVAGLRVYLWQEPDQGGELLARRLRATLPEIRILKPPAGIKDLAEAHLKGEDVPALVKRLRARAKDSTASDACSLAELANEVNGLLAERLSRKTRQRVAQILADWLLAHNRLLIDLGQDSRTGGRPYLVTDGNALWPLESDSVATRLALYEVSLNSTEPIYRFVLEALIMEAYKRGRRTTLSRWQASRGDALYVSCGPSHLVRARAGRLERLPNGTDGVWFAADSCYPAWRPTTPIHPIALSAFNPALETPVEVADYDPPTQSGLLAVWIAALISGVRPLPVLASIGRKGGGKTTVAKAVLRMLLGPTAKPTMVSDDRRDFWALVTSQPVLAYDNLDSGLPPWFMDGVAMLVTGASDMRRQLYSDNRTIDRPATAALILTTRVASFARADVSERTLPLFTGVFDDRKRRAEAELLAEVDAQRNGLLSWATQTAQALLTVRDDAPPALPLRFVDYGRMVWAYMRQQGSEKLAEPMLDALRRAQALAVGEADPLVEAILSHWDALAPEGSWWGGASQLVRTLTEAGADLPYLGGGKRIANQLREARETLALAGIDLREQRDRHGHTSFGLLRTTGR